MKYIAFDPGETTGIVVCDNGCVTGYEIVRDTLQIAELIETVMPDVVIVEKFVLYPGKAKAQSWSSFYPVEVIGVIKHICQLLSIEVVLQGATIKNYSTLDGAPKTSSRHIKDAYLHLWHYLNVGKGKGKKK